jgi:hypothetical protein
VIECVPTASVDVVKVATWNPPTVLKVPVPRAVVPSLKVTVPVGGFVPVVTTVAVKVTATPCFAGFELEVRVVVVAEPAAKLYSQMPRPYVETRSFLVPPELNKRIADTGTFGR